jgi:transaldolase
MPEETILAFQEHGRIEPNTVERDLDGARRLFGELTEAGIDLDDVWETLEREGVQKFIDSFDDLLEGIRSKRAELAPA